MGMAHSWERPSGSSHCSSLPHWADSGSRIMATTSSRAQTNSRFSGLSGFSSSAGVTRNTPLPETWNRPVFGGDVTGLAGTFAVSAGASDGAGVAACAGATPSLHSVIGSMSSSSAAIYTASARPAHTSAQSVPDWGGVTTRSVSPAFLARCASVWAARWPTWLRSLSAWMMRFVTSCGHW